MLVLINWNVHPPSPGDSPISEKSLVDPSDEDVSNDNAEREGEKEGEKKEEGEDKEEGNKSVCVCVRVCMCMFVCAYVCVCLCVCTYVHVSLGVGGHYLVLSSSRYLATDRTEPYSGTPLS